MAGGPCGIGNHSGKGGYSTGLSLHLKCCTCTHLLASFVGQEQTWGASKVHGHADIWSLWSGGYAGLVAKGGCVAGSKEKYMKGGLSPGWLVEEACTWRGAPPWSPCIPHNCWVLQNGLLRGRVVQVVGSVRCSPGRHICWEQGLAPETIT